MASPIASVLTKALGGRPELLTFSVDDEVQVLIGTGRLVSISKGFYELSGRSLPRLTAAAARIVLTGCGSMPRTIRVTTIC